MFLGILYLIVNKSNHIVHSYRDHTSKKFLRSACNFSYPENEGDALLVEVQDKKKNSIQGRATIPVSSLTDNPVYTLSLPSVPSLLQD